MKKPNIDSPYCLECYTELHYYENEESEKSMLTDKDIAIYALGKTEGVHSIAETLGKGLDDEKYIESWNKTMKLLGNRDASKRS